MPPSHDPPSVTPISRRAAPAGATLAPPPRATPAAAPGLQAWLPWLAVCTALIFLGRGYDYLRHGAPLRVLFWDESLLGAPVERVLGRSWASVVDDQRFGDGLTLAILASAVLLLLAGAAALARLRWRHRALTGLVAAGWLTCLAYVALDTRDHFGHLAHFLEHAVQLGVPLLLLLGYSGRLRDGARLRRSLEGLVAVTFAAHGLYALGVYPVPGHFVDMTILSLGVSESVARQLLLLAGAADLLAAIALFWPPSRRYALGYMVAWGLATACARVVVAFIPEAPLAGLDQGLPLTIFRLPHGLLPLGLLLVTRRQAAPTTAVPTPADALPTPARSRLQEA